MVFPIVKTVESALTILNISIEFYEYLGPETNAALMSTMNKCKHRNKKSVPKNIHRYLNRELETRLSGNELEVAKNRLTNLFGAIVPLQAMIDTSRRTGAFPLYGQAIHQSLRTIHKSIYEWECFEGIPMNRLFDVQKIEFNSKSQKSGNKDQKDYPMLTSGNEKSRRILLEAKSTSKSIRESDLGHKLRLSPKDKIYFGLGEASHILYLHDSTKVDGFVVDSKKIIFQDHNARAFPLVNDTKDDLSNISITGTNSEKGLETGNLPLTTSEKDDITNTTNTKKNENNGNKGLEIKLIVHVLTRRDFILISRGLLKDLMIYSKLSRDEGVFTNISSVNNGDDEKHLHSIASYIFNFYKMALDILKRS